jgi:hypothetical protein
MTILREPIDRALSWLHYASQDVAETSLNRDHIEAAREFISSEGDCWSSVLDHYLRDPYTQHFLPLACASDMEPVHKKAELAIAALSEYGVIGFYDSLPLFMKDLCRELGLTRQSLPVVNVTTRRPRVEEISEKLRTRLEELTSADIKLYHAARVLVTQRRGDSQRSSGIAISDQTNKAPGTEAGLNAKKSSAWNLCVPEDTAYIVSCSVSGSGGGPDLTPGAWADFEFHANLRLPVKKLLVGTVIYEDSGREIFGTNSDRLAREFSNVPSGEVIIRFSIRLNLAPGRYVAGLAMYEAASDQDNKLLGWWDWLVEFEIQPQILDFAGITRLDSNVDVKALAGVETGREQLQEPLASFQTASPDANARRDRLNQELQEGAMQVFRLRADLAKLQSELSVRTSENEWLRRQIDSLQASVCWRLTWPIRWLHNQANALKKHLP